MFREAFIDRSGSVLSLRTRGMSSRMGYGEGKWREFSY